MDRPEPSLTLVLGGTRSGKSRFAAGLARQTGLPVTFLATARPGEDPEMKRRIREHRRRRSDEWETREPGFNLLEIPGREEARCYLLDEYSLLVSAWLERDPPRREVFDRTRDAARRMCEDASSWIVVSGLVGRGVVPAHPSARRFRDVLGRSNQLLAERATEVLEVIAGLPRRLKPQTGSVPDGTDPPYGEKRA